MGQRKVAASLLFLAGFLLLLGLWAGLVRLGWRWPIPGNRWTAMHGVLMVNGFLGTLIALERAVGFRKRWGFLAPALAALGTLLSGKTIAPIGSSLIVLGSAVLIILYTASLSKPRWKPALLMLIAALCWFVGNVLWAFGFPIFRAVPWWVGFLTLTIVAERLELSQLLHLPRWSLLLLTVATFKLILALLLSAFRLSAGEKMLGLSLLVLALWLLGFDMARKTVQRPGQMRFAAFCLLAGYIWLGIAGLFFWRFGGTSSGVYYDAPLHAFFLGFIFSVIFGHALIILPAILRISLSYHPALYIPLGFLHGSLLLRLAGDLRANSTWRQWGGFFNAISLLLFFLLVVGKASQNLPKASSFQERS